MPFEDIKDRSHISERDHERVDVGHQEAAGAMPKDKKRMFLQTLDENYYKKDGKQAMLDAYEDFFGEYRESEGRFAALLDDPEQARDTLELMRTAYKTFTDQIDTREWQERESDMNAVPELLSREVTGSLGRFDALLQQNAAVPEPDKSIPNNIFYVASEALNTAVAENRKKIESWMMSHAEEVMELRSFDIDGGGYDTMATFTLQNLLNRVEDPTFFNGVAEAVLKGEDDDQWMDDGGVERSFLRRCDPVKPDASLSLKQEAFADLAVGRLGLDADIVKKWKQAKVATGKKDSLGIDIYRPSYLENLEAARRLESRAPGSAKALYEQFGIANFSRYDREMLLRQLEKSGEDVPYGLVIYPEADWNGAFFQNKKQLAEMALKLRMGRLETRIVEVGSQRELTRRVVMFDKKYAPAGHKISFAIIGGHGESSSVSLGTKGEYSSPPPLPEQENYPMELEEWKSRVLSSDKGKFTIRDITEGRGINRAAEKFFNESAPIVLVSCSTGVEGGIAESASGKFGWEINAPNVPTNLKNISVSFDSDNRPKFDVEYFAEESSMKYQAGMKIDQKSGNEPAS
jgi:hypothetical protein